MEIHVAEATPSAVPEEPPTLPTPPPQGEKFVCAECKKVFKEFSRYARHCYGVHKMKKCKNCYKFFDTKEQLVEHKVEEHGIPCDCCGAKFVNINAQLSHLRRVHPEYKSCTCEVCGKSFNSKYGLAVHYECHQEDRPFLCDTCGKSFKSKRKLKIHKCISSLNEALRADNVCPECGKVYTLRSSLKRHLMRHRGERRYQCEICSKSFFGSAYLKNHMVIHEKATLYECQMCCARYFHKRNMISHLKMKHSMPWNYKCPTCEQIFPSIDDVVMHRKIHDIENIALGIPQESDIPQGSCLDFQCKICGKNFENIYVLTYHFEEHVIRNQEDLNIKVSGADGCLFECAYCGETQTSIWTMKRHVKKAHHETPSVGLIEYECEYCAKRFTTKSQVRQHLLLHTGEKPFHCQYCNAGFRTQIALKVHIRTHTGETPYPCQRCPKRFRSAATLRSHQGTHDKPFACPHCGQRFPKKAAYKKHVVLHTGETAPQVRRTAVEHKCKHCDYVSRSRSAIKKHEGPE
ncbi:hypothetical protein B566_EDAN009583 [Ephemera danica]|nr:hypothetical protein B566_EDAN009583 [Ephemera danica]